MNKTNIEKKEYRKALEKTQKSERDKSIDFIKGILVLSMVIYHILNYFISDSVFFKYLRFIAPGFILISGFMITNILYLKYNANYKLFTVKLTGKGIKLIVLFTCLNLFIFSIYHSHYQGQEPGFAFFFKKLLSIFFNDNENIARFEIIQQIGYLYLLAPLILWIGKPFKHFLNFLSIILILAVQIYSIYFQHLVPIWGLTYGFLGMALGFIPLRKMNIPFLYKLFLTNIFAIYLIVITLLSQPFLLQAFGTVLTLLIFYFVGISSICKGRVVDWINLLGRYSLVSYIIQIAILQVISRMDILHGGVIKPFIAAFPITLFIMFAFVKILEFSIGRSLIIKRLYRVVFM
jgi:peptidoglycan/LPS O-acetylase OafA/YrhL